MLDFSDQPYRFFPPRYFGPTAWVMRQYNRHRFLPVVKRIAEVQVQGAEHLGVVREPGTHAVLVPNHPTHADAAVFIEACRQVGVVPRIMAAYDVFFRGRLDGWVMQRLGTFSVDREGTDRQAMDQAARTLARGKFPLTLFPEGNVYLENDRVTPFHDGAAFLATRAAKQLAERGKRLVVVPVSIKATHLTDPQGALVEAIRRMARTLDVKLTPEQTALSALWAIGQAGVRRNLKHRGIDLSPLEGGEGSSTFIPSAAGVLLERLEAKLGLTPKPSDDALARVRAARRLIHEVRTDPHRAVDHRAAAGWADDAMIAFRIASYSGDYVSACPNYDRLGETVEKLHEDLYDQELPAYADRLAVVRFSEPIDVSQRIEQHEREGGRQKQLIHKLTREMENAVQRGVDEILPTVSQHPGSTVWDEPLGQR